MQKFAENMAQNLRKPSSGFFGVFTRFNLSLANKSLERNAVKLLKIQPKHNVLEIGFGPGHGITYVMNTGFGSGSGKMFGVDFSTAMCDYVRQKYTKSISSGKLKILEEDVVSMSLPDSYFDKVFHTNSHFYWPDLQGACRELHRVMKPEAEMVTVMNLARIEKVSKKMGVLKYALNIVPETYMTKLSETGFTGIEQVEIKRSIGPNLHAVICKKGNEQ